MAGGPDHAHRVIAEAGLCISNTADDTLFQILQTAYIVDDTEVGDVIEEAVDGEVPPQGIFCGASIVLPFRDLQRARTPVLTQGRGFLPGRGVSPEKPVGLFQKPLFLFPFGVTDFFFQGAEGSDFNELPSW
jgi:hypothetical protein